ncbi:P-loop containing nucleoside triphosphate hydrolase protein [Trichoderma citrinoviride]|uniref:P-loop containing nucleoside triphosphate hydrolase protein n=1 Tax=Trichoderma citrinoviride TaxID=58853 RepID=A0A2T4BBU5_9HYPO|nr:P-loop containing nucleoside triphosphate hydrolase protein [Trichoderma citrinoviride]PTB66806.1 P-loop containing nucleoside triphosphate hydrolase protein [Trichoderma citrinoviride]
MAEVPIVQRFIHCDTTWITESFTINSPHMRKILLQVLADYQDLDLELDNWTFRPPYIPLVHRWQRLQDFCKDTTDAALAKAGQEMIDFLLPIVGPSVNSLAQTRLTGKVKFDSLWQIFPPGELVMTQIYGQDTICRVLKHELIGKSYSSRGVWTKISGYEGYARAHQLPTWPIAYASDPDAIKTKMVARGRQFEDLRTYHFMQYEGRKIVTRGRGKEEEPVSPPSSSSTSSSDEPADADDELKLTAKSRETRLERKEHLAPLTDEQCMITTPWVRGFDLKAKEWALFLVEEMKDIVWNDDAFSNLVLPGDEKELAWSFIENKNFANSDFDDFVADKGRGIIILMFGPPGVGKTFTAEAVAENGRVPLYAMSAGALGTKPLEVEEALDRALELCRLWNAMLLLDEADVFLSARKEDTLARNELVSIFLTKLEYYQGILFLTTNRAASLDHAFQSRVDLFLPYNDLTTAARRKVWQNFIVRAGGETSFGVAEEDYDRLAELKLNGREIKNLIKSARLLNMKSRQPVTTERLAQLAEMRITAMEMLNRGEKA